MDPTLSPQRANAHQDSREEAAEKALSEILREFSDITSDQRTTSDQRSSSNQRSASNQRTYI